MEDEIKRVVKKFDTVKDFKSYIQEQLSYQFNLIKAEMIKNFNEHNVTKEIEAGISSDNISGTLDGVSDPKNLYSFIGFKSGENPTEKIRRLLQSSKISFSSKNGQINSNIYIPSPEEIFEATPMPWATGRSWAQGIELGISGLGYYLNEYRKSSRSGLGIQINEKLRDGVRFKNVKYISAILKDAQKKLERINIE